MPIIVLDLERNLLYCLTALISKYHCETILSWNLLESEGLITLFEGLSFNESQQGSLFYRALGDKVRMR